MAKISKIFGVLMFLQVLYEGSYSQENCNPYTKCALQSPGYEVVDPRDCHNYYICVKDANGNVVPSDDVYKCNSGYYFRETSQSCYSGSTCTNNCLNKCKIECNLYAYERIAVPDDCSSFYTCAPDNLKIKSQCPSQAPYFDGTSCSVSSYTCCDTCVPWCEVAYSEIRDPFDCRNYYQCTDTTGEPSESNLHNCPESEYFDSSIGTCTSEDPNNPCVPLCSKRPSTDTTTEHSLL